MDAAQQRAIKEDYLAWTGGFPPDSESEIFTYIEASMPLDCDLEEVRAALHAWMAESSQTERTH